jgi:hypothetical protein
MNEEMAVGGLPFAFLRFGQMPQPVRGLEAIIESHLCWFTIGAHDMATTTVHPYAT